MDCAPPSGSSTPNSRFIAQNVEAEDKLKSQTVGLVHLEDYKKRRAEALDQSGHTSSTSDNGS